MQINIAVALAVSLVLIGGATFNRFANNKTASPTLSVVNNPIESKEELLKAYLTNTKSTTTEESLTGTDLVGRQLMIDYLNLASRGQADPDSLAVLVDRYVESIPTLNQKRQISYADIKIGVNSKESFQLYANKLESIYQKYSIPPSAEADYEFLATTATSYEGRAQELMGLTVPAKLALAHLGLVNSSLSNSSAFKAMAGAEQDPMTAMAGLSVMNSGLDKEVEILKEISQILKFNGI